MGVGSDERASVAMLWKLEESSMIGDRRGMGIGLDQSFVIGTKLRGEESGISGGKTEARIGSAKNKLKGSLSVPIFVVPLERRQRLSLIRRESFCNNSFPSTLDSLRT
jgi:hypothetical protein